MGLQWHGLLKTAAALLWISQAGKNEEKDLVICDPTEREALKREVWKQTCISASWVNNVVWCDIDTTHGYPSLDTIYTAVLKAFHSLKMLSCLGWCFT